ncbi:MAG: hypothetical protein WC967_00200 [Balneolaceae bacterium]
MSKLNIQASAPGKLILLGEYAVLEQAPCLVVAVDRSCNVDLKPIDGNVFSIEASNQEIPKVQFSLNKGEIQFLEPLSDVNRNRLRFVLYTLNHVIEQNNNSLPTAVIHIDSASFYHKKSGNKLGLGASAAITVSLLSALSKLIGKPLTGQELYRTAHRIHRKAQGKIGSGADIAASSVGGILQYRMAGNGAVDGYLEQVTWPKDLIMIPIWAGYSASTQDMVRKVESYRDENPNAFNAIMDPLKQLSKDGCLAFRNGDTERFLAIVDDFIEQERKLGEASDTEIISEAHLQILEAVKDAGGVYKPSGAGSGDIGVAFCNNLDTAQKIMRAVESKGFDKLDLSLQKTETNTFEQHTVA